MARRPSGGTALLLVEIGCEELPPKAVGPVLEQLAEDSAAALRDARIETGTVTATGTLRRLVLMADGVAFRQSDRVTLVRGPAARIAFDPSGAPTQAARGFARSQGVPVESLQIRDMEGGRYAVAEVRETGRPTAEVLAQILPRVVAGLTFPKTMRWAANGFRFGRPIRRVVALLDGRVVPLEVAGLRAGRRTAGHRFLAPRLVSLRTAEEFAPAMRVGYVILDHRDRRQRILTEAEALAAQAGGRAVIDADLLDELTWSTEHPTPLLGWFDPALAALLPREVVLVTLQRHQKSFGVEDADGALLPAFIAVRDGGTAHLDTVRTGHEWVVRARLEDARFFLEEDRNRGLLGRTEELSRLAHTAGLGSVADHVQRLLGLVPWLAQVVKASEADRQALERAAALCKTDLVTALVREFPELQGTVGRLYALEAGESPAVATAIEEHYWPKTAGGAIAQTRLGALLAIADRALLLTGAVLAGLEPTGSQDPYGMRRAASGIVATLQGHALHLGVGTLLARAVNAYDAPADARQRTIAACAALILQRLRLTLMDRGVAHDTVEAVLATGGDDVADLTDRARALQAVRRDPAMTRLATGFARASRILGQGEIAPAVEEARLTDGAERGLYEVWYAIERDVARAVAVGDYAGALAALVRLADPIDRFFDDVLVMAPDLAVRGNRLALLQRVTATFLRVAEFGRLSG